MCHSGSENKFFEHQYQWESNNTMSNWITSLNLECNQQSELGMIGSLYFLGFGIGAATLLGLADTKGRRPLLIFSIVATFFFNLGYLFANSLLEIYILTFLNGLGLAVRISVSYMYEMEMIPMKLKKSIH